MLVDSHCHLDFDDFEPDFEDVLSRAAGAGVDTMVTICTQIAKFPRVRNIAERHKNIFCSVGVHPHSAEKEPHVSVQQLVGLSSHPKVVGIGETGLDFFYDKSPRDTQETLFRAHIAASRQTELPLIVHTRDADDDTLRILEEEYAHAPFPGLIHCFTATRELAERVLDLGFYISLSGILTFKNAEDIRATVKDLVPLNRILVETDAPYLAPVPNRGKRNEPANTAHTATYLAQMLGVDEAEFAHQTTENFYRLFWRARQYQSFIDQRQSDQGQSERKPS
jgi:TatD DNase family protein